MENIGRYRIVRELGRGAMGVVYHAIDPSIGRPVAIKTIRLGEASKPEERARLRERLFREARAAGKLSHPGIVTIYDMEDRGELAYIAMEFVNGPTLDSLLSQAQPLAREKMLEILHQTAAALDHAHQKGIVHRDIKPANIMLDEEGAVKVTDFGIAKAAATEQYTITGSIVGTPNYMSPEQVQGQAVDGRADQFSLAVVAFEMLTGEKPFGGDHLTTVVYKIVAEEPAAPHQLNPTLSVQIDAVVRKALAKKPAARYATCGAFVDALEEACKATRGWQPVSRGASLDMPTAETRPRPAARRIVRTVEDTGRVSPREHRRTGVFPVIFGILVAAGLVGLIAWQASPWLTNGQHPEAEQAAPAPAAANPSQSVVTPAGTAPAPAGSPEEQRPSPMGPPPAPPEPAPPAAAVTEPPVETPAAGKPAAAEQAARTRPEPARAPVRKPSPAPAAVAQSIWVATNPPGARAVMDGSAELACTTPCMLKASPGQHGIQVSLAGYQSEYREVEVGRGPMDLPLIGLRRAGGTLMLTTSPPGATILVNGRAWSRSTPAQLTLAPGTYNITVERNGQRVTEQVVIRDGMTSYLKIPLGR